MGFKVNLELCTGCGTCMEACSFGAIQLLGQQAVIDDTLCTECETCIDACPKGLNPTQAIETLRNLVVKRKAFEDARSERQNHLMPVE